MTNIILDCFYEYIIFISCILVASIYTPQIILLKTIITKPLYYKKNHKKHKRIFGNLALIAPFHIFLGLFIQYYISKLKHISCFPISIHISSHLVTQKLLWVMIVTHCVPKHILFFSLWHPRLYRLHYIDASSFIHGIHIVIDDHKSP